MADLGDQRPRRDVWDDPGPEGDRGGGRRGQRTTRTDPTDLSISTYPQAALPQPPARPSGPYDETGSGASAGVRAGRMT